MIVFYSAGCSFNNSGTLKRSARTFFNVIQVQETPTMKKWVMDGLTICTFLEADGTGSNPLNEPCFADAEAWGELLSDIAARLKSSGIADCSPKLPLTLLSIINSCPQPVRNRSH
jgi:hypothetical protein